MKIQGRQPENKVSKWLETRKDNEYSLSKGNLSNKNLQIVRSNFNNSRETSPYRMISEYRSRGHLMSGGRGQEGYREASKNSRSSAVKSIRGHYGVNSQSVKSRGEAQPATGLNSKL